ncbi:MAG: thermopsin [Candidatus Marsarchaeota archaeon]|nr:thermopsin [Candidatus Marsarchaeota archaeon]
MESLKWYISGAILIAVFVAIGLHFNLFISPANFLRSTANIKTIHMPSYNSSKYYSRGVVSYGLAGDLASAVISRNASNLTAYQVTTNGIFGCVDIHSIAAYTPNSPLYVSEYGAGLQLNINLIINTTNGLSYVYWLQNAMLFNTSDDQYQIMDSIYNLSFGYLSNISKNTLFGKGNNAIIYVSGNGAGQFVKLSSLSSPNYIYTQNEVIRPFSNATEKNGKFFYLNFTAPWYNYTLPFTYCPIIMINSTVNSTGTYPVANFGYSINGNSIFYDNVTFAIPSTNAYLLVTPYKNMLHITALYDAEFVFGGEGNNQSAAFTEMNATGMWLFYQASNGTFVPFPSLYSSGADTSEAATNLQVTQGSNYASVGIGTPNLFSNMTLHSSEYNSTEYANVASWIEGK